MGSTSWLYGEHRRLRPLLTADILHQMVKCQPLDRVFAALADPTRMAIVARLMQGQSTVGELAKPFEISPSGFSKHLRVLERAGLLRQHKRGRERYCEVVVKPLEDARTWIDECQTMWVATLDSFAEHAESQHSKRGRQK